jgi:hypothetical protein
MLVNVITFHILKPLKTGKSDYEEATDVSVFFSSKSVMLRETLSQCYHEFVGLDPPNKMNF